MGKEEKKRISCVVILVVATMVFLKSGEITSGTIVSIVLALITLAIGGIDEDTIFTGTFVWLSILLSAVASKYYAPMGMITKIYDLFIWGLQLSIQIIILGGCAGILYSLMKLAEVRWGTNAISQFFIKISGRYFYKKWKINQEPARILHIIRENVFEFTFFCHFGKIGLCGVFLLFDLNNIVARNLVSIPAELSGLGVYSFKFIIIALTVLSSLMGLVFVCVTIASYVDPFVAEMREANGLLALTKLAVETHPKEKMYSNFEYFWKIKRY